VAVVALMLLVVPGSELGSTSHSPTSRAAPLALPVLASTLATSSLPHRGLLPPTVPGAPTPIVRFPTALVPGLPPLVGAGLGGRSFSPLAIDPANPELDNYSSTTSLAAPGPGPNHVVVGATDSTDALVGDHYFWTHGFDAVFQSSDAGSIWSSSYLGQNLSWANPSSTTYGDLEFGEPSLAAGNGTVLYAAIYAQACAVYAVPPCNNTVQYYSAPGGISVARSTNSGTTWGAPVPVNALPWWTLDSFTCNGTGYEYYIPGNESDKPSVAYSAASNVALVAWDVLHDAYVPVCSGTTLLGFELIAVTLITEAAVSLNGGATWSAPRVIDDFAAGLPTVSIGPPPTDKLFVAFSDFANGTSAGTYSIGLASSSNNGSTWSNPADIGPPTLVSPVNASAINFPTALTDAVIASDNFTSSPYSGSVYVVWDENRSAGGGIPSVALVRSANGGASWSSEIYPAAGTARVQYLEPTVAVGPNGAVWITEYAQDRTTHAYQLYGEYSTDGGNTWTQPFAISDTPGAPGFSTTSLGTWTGAAVTSAGLFAAWTDCRWSGCAAAGETAVYTARAEAVRVTATVPGINVTVVSAGANVSGPAPFATAWDFGSPARVTVSPWTTEGNTTQFIAQFHNFTGIVNASVNPVAFDYSGGTTVEANYQQAPAGWITGTVAPASANPIVTVGGALATLSPFNATALSFNVTEEAGGIYTVQGSASGYVTTSKIVPSTAFTASVVHLTLSRADGWIRGRLTPATATLTVDNVPVTTVAPSTGLFNVTLPWGTYWVNASGAGLTSYSQVVTVSVGSSVVLNIGLAGSWISGTVAPGNATVKVDGTPATVTNGKFNVSVLGGAHTVTASLSNYAGYHTVVSVTPGRGEVLAISLTDLGWIRGTVSPVTASVAISGVEVPVIGGAFNVSVRGNATYNVTVTSSGYHAGYAEVTVSPANGSFANFSLVAIPPKCTSSCGPGGGGGSLNLGSSVGAFSLLDVVVAALVLLGGAALGAFLILRRPSGPPPETEEAEAAPARAVTTEPEEGPDDMIYGEDRSAPEPWSEGEDPSQGLQPPR